MLERGIDMAYSEISITTGDKTCATNVRRFSGLSTDTKPTENVGYGSSYYEVDTMKYWTYDININPATSNHWWSKTATA